MRAKSFDKNNLQFPRKPSSRSDKLELDSRDISGDAVPVLPVQVALHDENLNIRLDGEIDLLQSDDFRSTSLNPLVGTISCESDIGLKNSVGEASNMQGVKNSMKWKRRAREHAGNLRTENLLHNSILGHTRDSGVNLMIILWRNLDWGNDMLSMNWRPL